MDVSRETQVDLDAFAALVAKWSPRINLVSKASLKNLGARHIADSVQLFHVKPSGWDHWVDLGSGGGFPGIVIAILAKHLHPSGKVTLIESDARKCAFLRTVARELGLHAEIANKRIEAVSHLTADIVSARALAPLPQLLALAQGLLTPESIALFPKGKSWREEVEAARQEWSFRHDVIQSATASDAVILRIQEVQRA